MNILTLYGSRIKILHRKNVGEKIYRDERDQMIIVVLTIILALYGSMNWLIARTFAKQWPNLAPFIYTLIAILAICSLLVFVLQNRSTGAIIGIIGSYWIAVSFLGFVLYGIFLFIPKNTFWVSTILLICLLIAGIFQAERIQHTTYNIKLDKQTESFHIVLISDLHLGYVNGAKKLETIVENVNELNPDAILIAGDLFDSNFKAVQQTDRIKEALNSFEAKHGTYLAWGNHDAGDNFNMMKEFIEDTSLILLEDEIDDAGPFYVIGRKDIRPIGDQGKNRASIAPLLDSLNDDKPVLLMDHQPSNIDEYDERVDLIVSGHTHRGQIYPFNYITKAIFPIDYGVLEKENGSYAIVTSGVGFWGPPIRLGTKSEIVSIQIN